MLTAARIFKEKNKLVCHKLIIDAHQLLLNSKKNMSGRMAASERIVESLRVPRELIFSNKINGTHIKMKAEQKRV